MTFLFLLLGAAATAFAQEEGYTYVEEADVRLALEETLSQPEFARLKAQPEREEKEAESPEWLSRFFRWLDRLFGGGEEEESPTPLFGIVGMGMVLAVIAAIFLAAAVAFLVRSILSTPRDRKVSVEEPEGARLFRPGAAPGEIAPEEFWRRALEHAERRRYKEGIRELLLGAMSATERRGLIRFRRGLTNRDYLYSVRGPARESFRNIASAFEHVYFGRREATAEAFRESSREYQKSFRGASP